VGNGVGNSEEIQKGSADEQAMVDRQALVVRP
jgi:hypothetical protein